MTDAIDIDVVIPVWNRPNETRNCLVNLINNTPNARLIMYDCGSDRETEKLLQEFADGLEDRALLMHDDSNIGFVRAANRGLRRCEAPYIALVRNTTVVSAGWIEPLLHFASEHREAGILLPCLKPVADVETRGKQTGGECPGPTEVSSGSFSAMIITRAAFEEIGGLDEGLDGAEWCLRDYTRRAWAKGFLSYRVPGPAVTFREEVQLGSERRRKETLERSQAIFKERWGEGGKYVVHVPKGVEPDLLHQKLEWLVKGARYGDTFNVLVPSVLYKAAESAGLAGLHENVRLVPLPRLSLDLTRRHIFERITVENPGTLPVTAVDGIAFPWTHSYLSFTELCEGIRKRFT